MNSSAAMRRRAAAFWLNALFWQARHAPIIGRVLKPLAMHVTYRCSRIVRDATRVNARRIFGPSVSVGQIERYAKGVFSNFFDFICDVGRCVDMSDQELRAQIASVEGDELYRAARAAGKGAIIVTAHMGSFEAAASSRKNQQLG